MRGGSQIGAAFFARLCVLAPLREQFARFECNSRKDAKAQRNAKRFSNENAPDKSRSHPDPSGARAESLCREILRLLMQYDTHGSIQIRGQNREFPLFIAL